MKAERWKQVNDLFQSAVERASEVESAHVAEGRAGLHNLDVGRIQVNPGQAGHTSHGSRARRMRLLTASWQAVAMIGMAVAGLGVSLFSQRIDRRLGILISLALLSAAPPADLRMVRMRTMRNAPSIRVAHSRFCLQFNLVQRVHSALPGGLECGT